MLDIQVDLQSQSGVEMLGSLESSFLQNLMQAGYLAVGDGRFSDARTIFQGLRAARPESEYPWLGLAVTEMSAGNQEAARSAISRARQLNPDGSEVIAFEQAFLAGCETN